MRRWRNLSSAHPGNEFRAITAIHDLPGRRIACMFVCSFCYLSLRKDKVPAVMFKFICSTVGAAVGGG